MLNKNTEKYNSHAKFMAKIAIEILKWNKSVLDVNWVKEIIALYLLIPYITPDTLVTPCDEYIIPKIRWNFCSNVSLESLRHSLCHMFITAEIKKDDWSYHWEYIIFDDRIFYKSKVDHNEFWNIWKNWMIKIDYVHNRLLEIFTDILKL